MDLVGRSRLIAERMLAPLGDRWKHVQGVANRAMEIATVLDKADRSYLIAAAYLHDVGYAPQLHRTGLHQLDGASYVSALGDARLTALVAHHSEARFEVRLRGFATDLAAYEREESPTVDGLTYCDLTTGPVGQAMTFDERISEVVQRYGECEITEALRLARPYLKAAVGRTIERLRELGLPVEARQ